MLPTLGALVFFALPLCMAATPSEPTLTVHQAALSATCTTLVATSVTCWPATATPPPLAARTPGQPIGMTVQIKEQPWTPEAVSCSQFYKTETSCAIGVHPQPTFGGNPTTITEVETQTSSAGPVPITTTATRSVVMSIGILDASLNNPAGDTWELSWTDEVRDNIVDIANSYCAVPKKAKRDYRKVKKIACDMRTLEAGQQEGFNTAVVNELENSGVDLAPEAVEAFAATGLTTLQLQRAVTGAIGLAIGALLLLGTQTLANSMPAKKADVVAQLPKVTTAWTTPSSTSTPSSSSSSSSSYRACPLCSSCVPFDLDQLDGAEGQIGLSIPPTTSVFVTTTLQPYKCTSGTAPDEPVTFNRGPWCGCNDGKQYSTSTIIYESPTITEGTETTESVTDNCPYTTPPPPESSWKPRLYNLDTATSCDPDKGTHYGLSTSDLDEGVATFCAGASSLRWYVESGYNPSKTLEPGHFPTQNALLAVPEPTIIPAPPWSFPLNNKGDWRTRMAIQVKYDINACDNPENPSMVDFKNKPWCEYKLKEIFHRAGCGGTRQQYRKTPYWELVTLAGGMLFSECLSWEIYYVGHKDNRLTDCKDFDSCLYGGKFTLPSNGTGLNSTWWNSPLDEWLSTPYDWTTSNSTGPNLPEWSSLGWNSTMLD